MSRTALVTGASRGIGKAIAVDLARAGWDVAIAARALHRGDPTLEHTMSVHRRDLTPLPGCCEEIAALVEAEGQRCLCLRMDLLDLASVEGAVAEALGTWGHLDLVVNNG